MCYFLHVLYMSILALSEFCPEGVAIYCYSPVLPLCGWMLFKFGQSKAVYQPLCLSYKIDLNGHHVCYEYYTLEADAVILVLWMIVIIQF